MLKAVLAGTASLMLAGSSLVYAQQQSAAPAAAKPAAAASAPTSAEQQALVMAEHMAAFAAAHLAALKAGLKLTPEQEKDWAPFEQAMNEMTKLESAQNGAPPPAAAPGNAPENEDPVAELKRRADEMFQEASALKHLSDAVGPLYASLDENQKHRFHMLAPPTLSFHLGNGGQNQGNEYGGMPEMGQAGGYGEPMMGAPMQGGYGGPMMGGPQQQGNYGGPMMGGPQQQGGYGGPMMGGPQQQGNYGGPMMGGPQQQGGYGGPMMGGPQQQGGYGGPMMGGPQQQGNYSGPMMGGPQQRGNYGGPMMDAPPEQGGYGGPMGAPQQGYGGPMMGGPEQSAQNEYAGPEGGAGMQPGMMSPYGQQGAPYGQSMGSGYEPDQQEQGYEEPIDE